MSREHEVISENHLTFFVVMTTWVEVKKVRCHPRRDAAYFELSL